MEAVRLGESDLDCSRLAYGCWRLAGTWNPAEVTPEGRAQGRRAVLAAFEAGYTLFDNADIYCRGIAEEIFGEAMKASPGMREKILIATKCGIRFAGDPDASAPHRYDFSAEHIIRSCEGSLRRMGVETIDLYQLHRPDLLCDPVEVAEAFEKLQSAGKARFFGVSNFRPSLVTALRKACPMPLVVHQVEISLAHAEPLTDGILDQCLTERMTPLAWSPLARGTLAEGPGKWPGAKNWGPAVERILAALDQVAKERGTSRMIIALAWLLKHPAGIVPIVGSIHEMRIREAVNSAEVNLSREEWYRLLLASRGEPLP